MISRIGLTMSVMLCAGAGYLFFVPKGNEEAPPKAAADTALVREIAVPAAREESLHGEIVDQEDVNHALQFNAAERTYLERYGAQHIGEGAFQTFSGSSIPHFLKPLGLTFEPEKEYLFLAGISENRVFEISLNTEESIALSTPQGKTTLFVKKTE